MVDVGLLLRAAKNGRVYEVIEVNPAEQTGWIQEIDVGELVDYEPLSAQAWPVPLTMLGDLEYYWAYGGDEDEEYLDSLEAEFYFEEDDGEYED